MKKIVGILMIVIGCCMPVIGYVFYWMFINVLGLEEITGRISVFLSTAFLLLALVHIGIELKEEKS